MKKIKEVGLFFYFNWDGALLRYITIPVTVYNNQFIKLKLM